MIRRTDRLYWVLLAAACAGVLWFALRGPALPDGALATVNGVVIDRARVAEFDAAAGGQSDDRRDSLTRAIDQELWLQRAWQLGLVHDDPLLREQLIGAVQQRVLAEQPIAPPTPAALRALYARQPERFRQMSGLRVQRWYFSPRRDGNRGAWSRATEAHRLLQTNGGKPSAALAALIDVDPAPLGNAVLPLSELRSRLGSEPTILVAQLRVGELSNPVQHDGAIWLYRLLERDAAIVPAFEALGPRIADEFLLQARERLLQAELARLRAAATIVADG